MKSPDECTCYCHRSPPGTVLHVMQCCGFARRPIYYVASRVKQANIWKDFRASGIDIVSTWIDEAGEGETDDFSELWLRIQYEIASCNTLVFYADKDDFPFKGALVEVGMALAMDKKVIVVLNDVQLEGITYRPLGSWCKHPNVEFRNTLNEAFNL